MLEQICQLSRKAGVAIMSVYKNKQPLNIKEKKDHSPVTIADLRAHEIIKCGLAQLTPEIPILSEEDPLEWTVRKHWTHYWLVDPLDGTKEFLLHNGEFTVNIALIEHEKAVMGVIYAPAIDVLYFAVDNKAWKEDKGECNPITISNTQPPVVVMSRSHIDYELQEYLQNIGECHTITVGSSLKFCLIAEGKAQLYPRFGKTNIWDTAAGHAIAIAAGAKIQDWKGNPLLYVQNESLLNPGFLVSSC